MRLTGLIKQIKINDLNKKNKNRLWAGGKKLQSDLGLLVLLGACSVK